MVCFPPAGSFVPWCWRWHNKQIRREGRERRREGQSVRGRQTCATGKHGASRAGGGNDGNPAGRYKAALAVIVIQKTNQRRRPQVVVVAVVVHVGGCWWWFPLLVDPPPLPVCFHLVFAWGGCVRSWQQLLGISRLKYKYRTAKNATRERWCMIDLVLCRSLQIYPVLLRVFAS